MIYTANGFAVAFLFGQKRIFKDSTQAKAWVNNVLRGKR